MFKKFLQWLFGSDIKKLQDDQVRFMNDISSTINLMYQDYSKLFKITEDLTSGWKNNSTGLNIVMKDLEGQQKILDVQLETLQIHQQSIRKISEILDSQRKLKSEEIH